MKIENIGADCSPQVAIISRQFLFTTRQSPMKNVRDKRVKREKGWQKDLKCSGQKRLH